MIDAGRRGGVATRTTRPFDGNIVMNHVSPKSLTGARDAEGPGAEAPSGTDRARHWREPRGIGRGIGAALAEAGADVVVNYASGERRRAKSAARSRSSVPRARGRHRRSDEGQVQEMFARTLDRVGTLRHREQRRPPTGRPSSR